MLRAYLHQKHNPHGNREFTIEVMKYHEKKTPEKEIENRAF